jgi:aldehyde:ferredoxin oxidoreductase
MICSMSRKGDCWDNAVVESFFHSLKTEWIADWNDIVPEDNKDTMEPAKVMKHVNWYTQYFTSVTGRKTTPDDLIAMSEGVYNFQRIFNLKMGFGRREHDAIPYRAMGPVTEEGIREPAETL